MNVQYKSPDIAMSPALSVGGLTPEQVQQIAPNLSLERATQLAGPLTQAMTAADANTAQRQSMFLAQLAQETDGFNTLEEYADGTQYEGREDLGNTEPGDGARFKGRGFIQLTGRSNYEAAGQALGLDLVGNPELASDPNVAAKAAAWYWNKRDINSAADAGDFEEVTRRINGGLTGIDARREYQGRAQTAVGEGVSLSGKTQENPSPSPAPNVGGPTLTPGQPGSGETTEAKPVDDAAGPNLDHNQWYKPQPGNWQCGPTSLTMAMASWGMRPADDATLDEMVKLTGANPDDGVPGNASLVANAAKEAGMEATFNPDGSAAAVGAAVDRGHSVILNGGLPGGGGHFIYVAGRDDSGNFLVGDPARPQITSMTPTELEQFSNANPGQHPNGFAEVWREGQTQQKPDAASPTADAQSQNPPPLVTPGSALDQHLQAKQQDAPENPQAKVTTPGSSDNSDGAATSTAETTQPPSPVQTKGTPRQMDDAPSPQDVPSYAPYEVKNSSGTPLTDPGKLEPHHDGDVSRTRGSEYGVPQELSVNDVVLGNSANAEQQKIPAPMSGEVMVAGEYGGGAGNSVVIKGDDGKLAYMYHMSEVDVKKGDRVEYGQVVGKQGNTGDSEGAHVHIEAPKDVTDKWVTDLNDGRFDKQSKPDTIAAGEGQPQNRRSDTDYASGQSEALPNAFSPSRGASPYDSENPGMAGGAQEQRGPGPKPEQAHPLFAQAMRGLEKLGPEAGGYRNEDEKERIAGALALSARNSVPPIKEIHDVVASPTNGNLFAVWTNPGNPVDVVHANVDKAQAARQPLPDSLHRLQDADRQNPPQDDEQIQQQTRGALRMA
jgi:predicted chitinase/biotin carboxyl carrier protein